MPLQIRTKLQLKLQGLIVCMDGNNLRDDDVSVC